METSLKAQHKIGVLDLSVTMESSVKTRYSTTNFQIFRQRFSSWGFNLGRWVGWGGDIAEDFLHQGLE